MNLIANIAQTAAALLGIVVMLGVDITEHHNNGHSNSKYYNWLSKSGELLSPKRLLLLAVFIATFTTMAQDSWIVVMILAVTLFIQAFVLLSQRHWKLMLWNKCCRQLLATAIIITLIAIGAVAYTGSRMNMIFASRVTAMTAVMIVPITPLLTMLVAWLIGSGHGFSDQEPPMHQD